jgi:2-hydroxy-3-keto-5-methylthiopentenyl-1-phosphate phosphatase
MPAADNTPTVFLDFDGTISRADVVDAILERFAAPEWLAVEAEWRAGRLGSRECLRRQMALVTASEAGIDALVDAIGIDEGLVALLDVCAGAAVPVHIVSDGFDYCIRRLLRLAPAHAQGRMAAVDVWSSHLEPAAGDRWRTAFPHPPEACAHGCATCKPAVMRQLASGAGPAIFVGDGLSDRYAAGVADLVYAKDKLASYCVEQNIAHVPFRRLADVAVDLNDKLQGGPLVRRRSATQATA